MKRPKYKEMYEWESASHYATEQELERFKKMYAELFSKYLEKSKEGESDQYFGINTSSQVLFKKDNQETETTNKEKLIDMLTEYFGLDTPDGSYTYVLTRVKEAFSVGTMTLGDFKEFEEEDIFDLADFLIERINKEEIRC